MIDENVFLAEMTVLKKYFNRQIEDELLYRIYGILKDDLSTEQFQYSCQQIFRHEKFFPTPQNFLDYAKGSLDYQALDAWDNKFSDGLDESGKFAVSSLGGKNAIARSENIEFMRKDFLSAYKAHKTAPPKAPKPALPQAPEPVHYTPEVYSEEDLTRLEKAREADRLRTEEAVRKCKEKLGIK
jgi:hypothetical protein